MIDFDKLQKLADEINARGLFNASCELREWIEETRSAIKEAAPADARVDDLAALVRQLVRALKRATPDSFLVPRALDYLKRKGLQGNILRAPVAREQQQGKGG